MSGQPADPTGLTPLAVDQSWQPLIQAWRADGLESGFHPGWARINWDKGGLWFDAILLGSQPRNRALRINENTWELGDVCEVFIQMAGSSNYLQIHVTPENQRLQLLWPADGLERVRDKTASLEKFMISQTDWVQSTTRLGPGFWVAQVMIPAARLGLEALTTSQSFQTAVCRYDYAIVTTPVLSSTAPLELPSFHRHHEWQQLVLLPNT